MDKKTFKELTGEDPVDVLGQDWKNEVEEIEEEDTLCGNPHNNGEEYCDLCLIIKNNI